MPTYEYVRDEFGVETLVDVTESTPDETQSPDKIFPEDGDGGDSIDTPPTTTDCEVALFSGTNGTALKSSNVIIDPVTRELTDLYTLNLGNVDSTGILNMFSDNDSMITFKVSNTNTNYTLTFPDDNGSIDQHLTTDGTGVLSWQSSGLGDLTWVGGGSNIDDLVSIHANTDPPVIKSAGILSSSVVLSSGVSTAGHVVEYQDGSGKLISDSGVVASDLVTSTNFGAIDNVLTSSSVGTNVIQETAIKINSSQQISGVKEIVWAEPSGSEVITLTCPSLASSYSLTLPNIAPTPEYSLGWSGSNLVWHDRIIAEGSGNVDDDRVVRWDGTSGRIVQNSPVIINDAGSVSGVLIMECSSLRLLENAGAGTDLLNILSPSLVSSYTMTLPINMGTADYVMTTNGVSTTSWELPINSSNFTADNRILKTDTSSNAKGIQESGLTLDDSDNILKDVTRFLYSDETNFNLSLGFGAFNSSVTPGSARNISIGQLSLNTTNHVDSDDNISVGYASLFSLTSGTRNLCLGSWAGEDITDGKNNILIGIECARNVTTSDNNIIIGNLGGSLLTGASGSNILIGHPGASGLVGAIHIGNLQSTSFLAGVDGASLSNETQKIVCVDSNDQLTAEEFAMPVMYISGMSITDNTVSSKSISAGACRSDDNTFNIVSSGTLSPSLASSGANGLDTGMEAADTWYSMWVISDSITTNATASLLSISSTSPTMPAGYDKKRRVSWVRNDSSSNLYDYHHTGGFLNRLYQWDEPETTLELLTNGAATIYTNIDVSELVPPTSTLVYINTNHVASGSQDFTTFTNPDSGLTGLSPVTNPRAHRCFAGSSAGNESSASTSYVITCDSSQQLEYGNSSAAEQTDLWVLGFIDYLG